ncbi:cobyrinate a,c-diamide synthase [Pseudorhodoferax sp. Leaf267]|uniref:cobyrinate a,c-diamide synthase n=1 Tax=Pseudorhodoferax sp. Leaf267 TaxID=1736316 RepID=UPI0006FC7E83|nr:cobyrinate a,c-diamide synthase [Pseudorhodoferax sp. Leaf267]KQP22850.1 cobyrinic acid a,c-diamide synthase [Pseudorhodoferax sp. Leaf267]
MGAAISQRCPAVLVAAPASGQGKTTVACALARLHTRQGRRVRVFKCGPDFLDPFWLALASGAPVYQLDLWMTGEADCRARLHAAAAEADLVIVEGVMGLFDGQPSAADLARRFDLPVLAVVDASAMAGTFGALAHGLQHYQQGLRWAGVLANRVASERHAQMLQDGLRTPQDWQGALMRDAALALPERHLGLTAAHEVGDALARLDAAADALARTPLGRMELPALQRFAVDFAPPQAPPPVPRLLAGTTVAVARDAAFCFLYAANLDTLLALGARLVFFSPLQQTAVPDCNALWLPGGYPELHARRLTGNAALRASLAAHVQAGKPVWAECGGMMALFERITLADGQDVPQWGLLPGHVAMQPRLAALGPQQLDLDGQVLRGHTFHYSTCSTTLVPRTHTTRPGSDAPVEAVFQQGSIRASYFHAWFASNPRATAALFTREAERHG